MATGKANCAFGYYALSGCTGDFNTGIGYGALSAGTSGSGNVAVGDRAMDGSGGSYNTIVGALSLYQNSGNGNVTLGYEALSELTGGSYNVGIGYNAQVYKATGSRQLNINDALIGLEFKSGRTHNQIFTALKSYFSSYGTVSAIGFCQNGEVGRITYGSDENGDYIYLRPYSGSSLLLRQYDSTTITSRIVVYFINPSLSSSTADDCLS